MADGTASRPTTLTEHGIDPAVSHDGGSWLARVADPPTTEPANGPLLARAPGPRGEGYLDLQGSKDRYSPLSPAHLPPAFFPPSFP